jgi:outer membrane immunogenic protein
MKRRPSLVFVTLALSLFATNAWADGWVGKHPVPPPCLSPFAGAYLGLAAGYGQQRSEVTNTNPAAADFGLTFSDNDGAFTFGGYAGYNFQRCGSRFVFGVETDINYLNTEPTSVITEFVPPAQGGVGNEITTLESSIDWFGTLRGRAGWAIHDTALIYATAGLAYAKPDHRFSDVSDLAGSLGQTNSPTQAGWTVGGGAELVHNSNWFLRAEGLYVDLGSESHSGTFPVTVLGAPNTAVYAADWDDRFWVARLGVAYKFGERRERAVPLK